MKYALVNPNWDFTGSTYFGCRDPHVPLELLFAADKLREAGHDCLVVDAQTNHLSVEDVRAEVRRLGPDFLVIPSAPSYLFWRCPPPEMRVPREWFAGIGGRAAKVLIGPPGSATPRAAMRINEEQRNFFLRKVRSALWTLKGKRLAVLGLAFKGGTDDIRDSPAIAVIRMLMKERCEIVAYDPAAMERARKEFADAPISFAETTYQAAEKADALLILTDWEEFAALDFQRLRQALKHPIVIDGRNLYSRAEMEAHGFSYFSVGRQEAAVNVPASSPAGEREFSNEEEDREAA